jgi:EAL and modified HD-GYP domain-containing signal transduction protein
MSSDVFLARQPIVDADRDVFGYELFYRDGPDRSTAFDDPDAATRGVMERVFLQWGMERVVGQRFGLINASASLIVNGLHLAMPAEGMIIEVREPEPFDDDTVNALRHARMSGYHFALDNVSRLGDLERSELLPLASIVKIELTTAHHAEIARLIGIARDRSPGVLIVAEKVESADDLNRCIDHGFDLFQGYHLAEPETLRRPARRASRHSAVALRSALADNVDADRIEEIVSSDPSLTFRLLTAVNANAFGLDRRVESVAGALGLLGITKLRCLADLLASSHDILDDAATIALGAARGRMAAELLCDTDATASGVLGALLSVSDRMYDSPLGDVLDELPLSEELITSILGGHGPIGRTLDIVRACERTDRALLDELAPGRADELLRLHGVAAAETSPAATPHDVAAERSEAPDHA